MTNILTSTVDVSAGTPPILKWNGTPLYAANCPADSAIVIGGVAYFIASLTDTTHPVLTRDYAGTVPSTGLAAEISPYTKDQVDTATLNARTARLLQALSLSPAGIPLIMDGSGITDVDPGAGRVRFNSAANPTWAYVSKTDALGNNITGRLGTLDDSVNVVSRATLQFIPNDGSGAYLDFDVSGALVDGTTYSKVPVLLRAGSLPADQAELAMAGVPAGKDGTNGTNGSNGIGAGTALYSLSGGL